MDRLEINKLSIFEQKGVLQLLYILKARPYNVKVLRKTIAGRGNIMSRTSLDRALLLLTGIEFAEEDNKEIKLTEKGETLASVVVEFVEVLNTISE